MLTQVLVLDTETTGLDPMTGRCIEVAAVRYSLLHFCVIEAYSSLLWGPASNLMEKVNHIPEKSLPCGDSAEAVWGGVSGMASTCDAILAHNADFDRQWVPNDPVRCAALLELPWICTCSGVTWPNQDKENGSLISLALAHGLGVVDPHRALSDCLLLARLMTRCHELGHDVQAMLEQGRRPQAMFQAIVPFDDKDLAKAAGFKWEASTKRWIRKMAIEDAGKLGFPTRKVDG